MRAHLRAHARAGKYCARARAAKTRALFYGLYWELYWNPMGFSPLVAHPDSPREWPPGPLSPDAPGHPAGPNNGLLAGAQAGLAGRACGMALTIYTRTHWPSMCNVIYMHNVIYKSMQN
jgi:hypothetical protein